MKLTNPTDDELNAVFAFEIAGWKECDPALGCYLVDPKDGLIRNPPSFTTSADAVLPWLEKWQHSSISWLRDRKDQGDQWEVKLFDKAWEHGYFGRSNAFPKSAVIALLRAHGVEVEFPAESA